MFSNWLSGLKGAIALKVGRWAGTFIGGLAAGYVFTHAGVLDFMTQACAGISSPAAMSTIFGGFGTAIAALVFSVKDAKSVSGKLAVTGATAFDAGRAVQAAAQAGADQQLDADKAKISAVAGAMKAADEAAPKDKATILESLKTGAF